MPFLVSMIAALVAAIALPAAAGAADAGGHPLLADAETFAFALGEGAADAPTLGAHDVVVVDGQTPTERVDALHADGAVVLGYLSVGTIEPYRPWYAEAKPYRLERWDDWGEYWARVGDAGYRRLMLRVAADTLARGFDGLFLDNVDMGDTHRRQRPGMRRLVRDLDALVGPDRLLGAQNGDDIIDPLVPSLDLWNHEDVSRTYDFDTKRYVAQPAQERRWVADTVRHLVRDTDLFVTTTDYVARPGTPAERGAVRFACSLGAVPYVADIGLRRVPATPFRCP